MLHDDIARALPELRAHAESMMTTTARVTEPGTVEADPETGADVIVDGPLVYEGRCRVKAAQRVPTPRESADATVAVDNDSIHFPALAGPFEVGHVVTVTASVHQPLLVGRRYRITGLHEMELQTAQRVAVEVWRSPYGD